MHNYSFNIQNTEEYQDKFGYSGCSRCRMILKCNIEKSAVHLKRGNIYLCSKKRQGRLQKMKTDTVRRTGEKMETVEIKLRDEYIKLGQALKAAGIVESGVDAKYRIQDGTVQVNGQTELQRGKKLFAGDVVVCGNVTVKVVE